MSRTARVVLVGAIFTTFAGEAQAIRVAWDLRLEGTWSNVASVGGCGASLSPFGNGNLVSGLGFGIVGGGSDTMVDAGEEVQVYVPEGATGVTYEVSSATDYDDDMIPGEGFVEAFDDSGVSYGVRLVSGVGTKDVSALFGDAPIRSFELTAAQDGVRLRRINYEPPFDYEVAASIALSSFSADDVVSSAAEIALCGFTLRPNAGLVRLQGGSIRGVAISGGNPLWIEGGEELEIEFDEPVRSVAYQLLAAEEVSGGGLGGHFVEAFDAFGASLGLRSASDLARIDLSDEVYFGAEPISRFVLISVSDRIRLGTVYYTPLPEPAGGVAAAFVALAAIGRARSGVR